MLRLSSRREVVVMQVAVVGWLCASLGACAAGTVASSGNEAVIIELAGTAVSIENRTGSALVNTEVQLVPSAFPRPYFVSVGRLANGEKRRFVLEEFRMSDGTKYSRSRASVRSIKVVAADLGGNAVEREVPFK